ncbi:MAG: hypothetical protein U1E14_17475 [Geminicoccaceae bacterium]
MGMIFAGVLLVVPLAAAIWDMMRMGREPLGETAGVRLRERGAAL